MYILLVFNKKVFITYQYFRFSLVVKGYKKDLEENELWELPPQDQTTTQVPKFEKMWKEEQRRCALINRWEYEPSKNKGETTRDRQSAKPP